MVEVIPAILAKSYDELENMVRKLEPHVQRVHLDIIDGEFAPNTTVKGYEELLRIETPLLFDVHLMVKRPADQIAAWYKTRVDRFILHVESEGDLGKLVVDICEHGRHVCAAFNPDTFPDGIRSFVERLDAVQFMTVSPGFYGSAFLDSVLPKIKQYRQDHHHIPIMVDGGVTPETAHRAVRAGATVLVSGSYVMHSGDIAKAIEALKNA